MRPAVLLALLVLGACAAPAPPERVFAVFFPSFSTSLDAPAQAVVARAAAVANSHPGRVVHVAGFADANATADVIQLSQKRADAVSIQLQADGVPLSLIQRSAVGTPPNSEPGVERRRVEIDLDI